MAVLVARADSLRFLQCVEGTNGQTKRTVDTDAARQLRCVGNSRNLVDHLDAAIIGHQHSLAPEEMRCLLNNRNTITFTS